MSRSSASDIESALDPLHRRPRPQYSNLYNAVAGRITTSGLVPSASLFSRADTHSARPLSPPDLPRHIHRLRRTPSTRDTTSASTTPLRPDEVLLRKAGAPDAYAEPAQAAYGAHRWYAGRETRREDVYVDEMSKEDVVGWDRETSFVKAGVMERDDLPGSELLKVVHRYAAAFYAATTPDRGRTDWRSLDETALLAVGMLLEERCRNILGNEGWRTFTEDEGFDYREEAKRSVIKQDDRPYKKVRRSTQEMESDSDDDLAIESE